MYQIEKGHFNDRESRITTYDVVDIAKREEYDFR